MVSKISIHVLATSYYKPEVATVKRQNMFGKLNFCLIKAGLQYDAHTSVTEREGTERRASNCEHKTGRSVKLRDAPFPDARIDSSSIPPFSSV